MQDLTLTRWGLLLDVFGVLLVAIDLLGTQRAQAIDGVIREFLFALKNDLPLIRSASGFSRRLSEASIIIAVLVTTVYPTTILITSGLWPGSRPFGEYLGPFDAFADWAEGWLFTREVWDPLQLPVFQQIAFWIAYVYVMVSIMVSYREGGQRERFSSLHLEQAMPKPVIAFHKSWSPCAILAEVLSDASGPRADPHFGSDNRRFEST